MSWSSKKLSANVSTLKVHLGRFLRKVKNGEEVIVLDRNTPVAKIIPFSGSEDSITLIQSKSSWAEVVRFFSNPNHKWRELKKTPLEYLLEDREWSR